MFTQAQIAAITAAFQQALQALASASPTPVTAVVPQDPVAAPVLPGFDEAYYLRTNPDVAQAVARGDFTSGAQHYALYGKNERRSAGTTTPVMVTIPTTQITYTAGPGGWRVDDVVPPGTPGTVTIPKTQHTLSLPQPNPADPGRGEMLVGYIARVSKQCGAATFPTGLGALFLGTAHLFQPGRPHDTAGTYWPEAADRYYNQAAYQTAEQNAADARALEEFANQRPGTVDVGSTRRTPPVVVAPPTTPPEGEDVAIG
jgi:hypothetical protein